MTNVQIGKEYTVARLSDCMGGFSTGETVTVVSHSNGRHNYTIKSEKGITGFCNAEHLAELAAIKVGEKYVLTAIRGAVAGFKVGDTVTVTGNDGGHSIPFEIENKRGYIGWTDADCLEKAEGTGEVKQTDAFSELLSEMEGFVKTLVDALDGILEDESEEDKLKAGDKVKLISGGGRFPLRGFNNGEIYEVSDPEYTGHPEHDSIIQIIDETSYAGYAKADQVEKVTKLVKQEEEVAVPEFKVGDKVKFTKGNSFTNGYSVGETYVISNPDDGDGTAEIIGGGQETAYPFLTDLELVEEESHVFTGGVGDRVEIVDATGSHFSIGDKGKVVFFDESDSTFRVKCGGHHQWFSAEQLKLDEEDSYAFKVGDTVEVTDVAGTFEFNVGDRGVVEEVDGSSVPIRVRKEGERPQWFRDNQLKSIGEPVTAIKFKVGDIVKGKETAPYNITDRDMTRAVVTKVDNVCDDAFISVRILEHNRPGRVSDTGYLVYPKHFDLVAKAEDMLTPDMLEVVTEEPKPAEPKPSEPVYEEISWKEAIELIENGGTAYLGEFSKEPINIYTVFEFNSLIDDMSDIVHLNWFKKVDK